MYTLVSSLGLNAAVQATGICLIGKSVVKKGLVRHFKIEKKCLLSKHQRFSSKAVFTHDGCSDTVQDYREVVNDELISNSHGITNKNKVKVLLIEKSLALRSLASNEGPAMHHAHTGAVVHVRADGATNVQETNKKQDEVEVHLRVDQLMKDVKTSIEKSHNLRPYEDIEYVEETKDKKEKTELVGALSPNALDWRPQHLNVRLLGKHYLSLSKDRLTSLVVLTAMAGYAMAPASFEAMTFIYCSLGTGLTSCAANTINQFYEIPYDSQMDRTKNRILVRGLITPLHAICFATVCSTLGVTMLYFGVNGYAATLGALNLFLYTSIYTPLKRLSIINTWVGSVVGAIPPLIGWVGCSGGLEPGAWIMAAILYAWQFPHFNALSWNLRPDYSRAGYRMMSVTNPRLCKAVALRHSIGMIGICTLAPILGVTTWTFAVDSLPFNGYLAFLAWRFYKDGDSKSSRKLFLFSLIHLPAVMMLMIISKNHHKTKEEEDHVNNNTVSNEILLIPEGQISEHNIR